ncbi:MAG: hypothetical protein ABI725_04105 [Chloroflexota bacterium]
MRFWGLIVIAAMALACGSTEPPDLQVPLTSGGGEAYTLLVYDATGLVTDVRNLGWQPGEPTDGAFAFPERQQVEIHWIGGACAHRPTLEITGNASDLLVTVTNPADPNFLPFLPIGCPAVGIPLAVTISMSQPIQQQDVGMTEHY